MWTLTASANDAWILRESAFGSVRRSQPRPSSGPIYVNMIQRLSLGFFRAGHWVAGASLAGAKAEFGGARK